MIFPPKSTRQPSSKQEEKPDSLKTKNVLHAAPQVNQENQFRIQEISEPEKQVSISQKDQQAQNENGKENLESKNDS